MVDNEPMRALRHHVTGAIERGEGHPIVAHEISETGTPYLPDGYDGPVALCSDCGNNAPAAPVKRVHGKPDGPLCQPCRLGQLYLHQFCYRCGSDKFLWVREGIIEYATVIDFDTIDGEDTAIIDDSSWQTDTGTSVHLATWVECTACKAKLADVPYDVR